MNKIGANATLVLIIVEFIISWDFCGSLLITNNANSLVAAIIKINIREIKRTFRINILPIIKGEKGIRDAIAKLYFTSPPPMV